VKRHFSAYRVLPVNILPWKGALKLLGFPAWRAIRNSDLVLITDALLFDRGLYNPMHNYLSSLALWIPRAKKRKIPVILYNVSVGPVTTKAGLWCLDRVLRSADQIILRDEDSKKVVALVEELSVPIRDGADSALSAVASDTERIQEILRENDVALDAKARIGININAYGDAFIRNANSNFSEDKFLETLSETGAWIHDSLKAEIWLFGTQHMDVGILRKLHDRIRAKLNKDVPLFTNRNYTYAEILGLFANLDLLIGMRTHSIILASAVGVPVIGIVAYPKTYGYLERIEQAERAIPLEQIDYDTLTQVVQATWGDRESIRKGLLAAVERQRGLAWHAAEFLAPYLGHTHGS
jgi:polysaccharide pyruvyl transferase WcaK-like protein